MCSPLDLSGYGLTPEPLILGAVPRALDERRRRPPQRGIEVALAGCAVRLHALIDEALCLVASRGRDERAPPTSPRVPSAGRTA
jgi:hypothetical protein